MMNLLLLATVMSMPTPQPYMDLCRHDRMEEAVCGVQCEEFENVMYCASMIPMPDPTQCILWKHIGENEWRIIVIFRQGVCDDDDNGTNEKNESIAEEISGQEASERGDGKRMGEGDSYATDQDTEA